MIADLPKLAINDVIVYDNTSPLFDEIISHRLGLIPIPTDLQLLSFKEECKCKGAGCPNCTVRYTLSKEGEGIIYSGDLQPEHESFAIKENKIPIVELSKDQRIILEVEAVLGRGKDHAKWQSVQAPRYFYEIEIETDTKRKDDLDEFVAKLPKGLVEIKNNKLDLKEPKKLPVLESYMDKYDVDFIKIKKDPSKITYSFETDGSLNAKDALVESTNILINKYEEFGKKLGKVLK